MTTLAGTPYGPTETAAAYTQAAALLSDEFDTSGTDRDFCEYCEHAPCIAGAHQYCELWPRAIVAHAMEREIALSSLPWSPHSLALMSATRGLVNATIFTTGRDADNAMEMLVLTRDRIRQAIQEGAAVAR